MTDDLTRLKGQHVTADRRLDRLPQFDPHSRSFGIAAVLPAKPPRAYTWRGYTVLDQGTEGACVGFGWSAELLARPVVVPKVDNAFALGIYNDARKLDDWPGEDYSGTSVLAGAKAVQARGYMKEYRWGFSLNDLLGALSYAGPVVLGLNWMTGMMATDTDGYIRATGQVEGGHCITAMAVQPSGRRVGLVNSWGLDWGKGGHCWITYDDLEKLLHDQGEQCIPVGRRQV
jgi:hypothetical protein